MHWLFLISLLAQAPTFGPDNPEGLKLSPNPAIRHAWKRKVFWKISSIPAQGYYKTPAPTPAERQQMSAHLDALTALFKATPTGSSGEGFWIKDSRTLGGINTTELPSNIPAARFPHKFDSGLYPFYHEDILQNGDWRLSVAGETASVYYSFNRLPGRINQPIIAKEKRSGDYSDIEFYLRPRLTATYNNLPIYEQQVLLVTRPGRDPWVAVPLARVLKAAIPLYEQDVKIAQDRLAGLKKKNEEVQSPAYEQQMRDYFEKNNGSLKTTRPSNYTTRLASMERELIYNRQRAAEEANPQRDAKGLWYWNPIDALAAVQKLEATNTPACFEPLTGTARDGRYQMPGNILPANNNPNCREIVMTNWDYFDLKLPRTTPQILDIFDFGRCATVEQNRIPVRPVTSWDAPAQGCYKHADMWRELDWAAFAALIKP